MEDVYRFGTKRPAEEELGSVEKLCKLSTAELYKAPSGEELQALKVADRKESLAQSNVLRLQITELLSEVSVKRTRRKQIDEYLETLTDKLKTLEPSQQYKLSDREWLAKSNVKVPLVMKPLDVKGSFKFQPPDDVRVIGSYPADLCVKPDTHVDIALCLPKGSVHTKDFLNQAYLRKRALYLVCVAQQLLEWKDGVASLSFTYHHGNHMKPILVIKPAGKLGSHVTVHVHTALEESRFKRSRFHVNTTNVKKSWYEEQGEKTGEEEEQATPHYNTTMLHDMTLLCGVDVVSDALENAPGVKDGIKLLKVWLRQRELEKGYGCLSGFIVTMFVVHLLRVKKVNSLMSAYQTFRNTLVQLSQAEWSQEGISLCREASENSRPCLEDFHRHFSVVFVDGTGFVNLCAAMTKHTLNRVKHEARRAVQIMETGGVSYFDALFMKRMPFVLSFDQTLILKKPGELVKAVQKMELENSLIDHSSNTVHVCVERIADLLDRAIGKRVQLISHSLPNYPQWPVTESAPPLDGVEWLMYGVLLEPASSLSILDKGPSADMPEATEFRQFWGDKSEMRRFQDGSICEAVLWPCDNISQRRAVLGRIVKFILNRHADLSTKGISVIHNQLDSLLKPHVGPPHKEAQGGVGKAGTGEEEYSAYMQAFARLATCLRGLQLALSVHATHGITPELRYTEVFPVMPTTFYSPTNIVDKQMFPKEKECATPFIPAATVICMLEGSGKWPEDVEAIKRVKAAFHVQLASQIDNTNELMAVAHATHVDVLMEGYVFKLVLGYSHEITLLKRTQLDNGGVMFLDNEKSRDLKTKLQALPHLSSCLTALHHSHGAFSLAVRLAKRWMASQMLLADHVPHEAVELIIAHLILHPAPYPVPGSALVCFLRFLQFLSTFDWKSQPLLVNLSDAFTRENITEIHEHFRRNRATLPLMFIATPSDLLTSQWTRLQPSAPVLTRLVLLARASLATLQEQLVTSEPGTDYKQIFRPPLGLYDVVIRLKPEQLARGFQAVDPAEGAVRPKYGQKDASRLVKVPIVNLDLVQCYLKEIREAFGDVALFFYDPYGGHVIGMLWKPHMCKGKPFSEENVKYHMPDTTNSDIQLVPNAEAILDDLRFMGWGLVQAVEARTQQWPF